MFLQKANRLQPTCPNTASLEGNCQPHGAPDSRLADGVASFDPGHDLPADHRKRRRIERPDHTVYAAHAVHDSHVPFADPGMSGRLFFEPSISLLSSMDVDSSNLTGAEDWTQADGAAAFRSPPPPHHVVHRTPSAAVTAAALAATISIDTGHSSPPAVMPGGAAAATTIASPVTPAAFRPTAPRDSAAIPAYGMMVPAAKLQQSARSKEREQLLTSTLMFR